MCFFRYHFARALFHKIKKLGLSAFYKPRGSAAQKRISNILRQYFALPLLKQNHMKPEVERLERELRSLTRFVTPKIADKLNKFHLYIVNFWMRLFGAKNLSLAGALHKTNNILERYI